MKQKISANAVWWADLGLKLRSVIPNVNFAVRLGTKFIGWGQTLQIGLPSQDRDGLSGAYTDTFNSVERETLLYSPFKIKYVYSFAPYIGVQWDF
jgi:hypothetical protein